MAEVEPQAKPEVVPGKTPGTWAEVAQLGDGTVKQVLVRPVTNWHTPDDQLMEVIVYRRMTAEDLLEVEGKGPHAKVLTWISRAGGIPPDVAAKLDVVDLLVATDIFSFFQHVGRTIGRRFSANSPTTSGGASAS